MNVHLMSVADEENAEIIASFNGSSVRWDELKPVTMKTIKHCIAKPLIYICNLSGAFLKQMKIANVVTILEMKICFQLSSSFRASNILETERLLCNRVYMLVTNNEIRYRSRFGFLKGKSVHMTLLLIVNEN